MENEWKSSETVKYWLQGIGESTKEWSRYMHTLLR